MQNCLDWKITLKRELYRQNIIVATSDLRRTFKKYNREVDLQNPKQELAWQIHQHLKNGQSRSIQSNESLLPSYQRHPKLAFCIPIRKKVLIESEIQYIFGESLGKGSMKSKRVGQMLRFFKLQDQQITIYQKWSFLLQKYICPLDVIQRLELYIKLLKYGTRVIQSLILSKYPHLQPQILLKSIMSMSRYFQETKQIQTQLQVIKTKITSHFCRHCSLYNCINHLPCQQRQKSGFNSLTLQNERFQHIDNYKIDSLIQLLAQIKGFYLNRNNKTKHIKAKPCSLDCYRNLSYRDIQSRYRQFFIDKQLFDSFKLKELKSIFGFNPCSISKAFQNKCSKVLMLILLQSQNKLINLVDISQSDFLKKVNKSEVSLCSGGCQCKKGDCLTNKCQCFRNKRECSQTCRCQSVLTGLFASPQFCCNQRVISGQYPHLKVGFSTKDHNSLGLFTMNPICQKQIVFWASGKLFIDNIWNEFDEWFLNKSGEKACNLIFGNSNGKVLGGKYRFLIHEKSKEANLKQAVRWVNGIEYTVFLATRDINVEEELFLDCKCCLFQ